MLSDVCTLLASLWHSTGVGSAERCSLPPSLALHPRQCFCTTLKFLHHGRSCGCSSVTVGQTNRTSLQMLQKTPTNNNNRHLFIRPHRPVFLCCVLINLDQTFASRPSAGGRLEEIVPCGGHPQPPSGHGRSCRLDGECLVKEKKRGSVQGCWRTAHTVNQPDCPLVVETLKHRRRWWLQLTNYISREMFHSCL